MQRACVCVCVCKFIYIKFGLMKFALSVSYKIVKNETQKLFSFQNRKPELLIDGLIISN